MIGPYVEPLPGWRDPIETLGLLARDPMPVLLHSAGGGAGAGYARWSILCADPFERLSWSAGMPGDPIGMLQERVDRHRVEPHPERPFSGGGIGYIGYDVGRSIEPVRARPRSAAGPALPDLLFGLYAWAVVWDHATRRCSIVSTGLPEAGGLRPLKARSDARMVAERLRHGPERPGRPGHAEQQAARRDRPGAAAPVLGSSLPRSRYIEKVEQARRLIAAGEVYQVNLSQRLEMAPAPSPVGLFAAVARHSPAPFSAYLDAGEFQVASASPERFLSLRGRVAESCPIKGTRPRGATIAADARMLGDLRLSSKDRAENVMIVDLVRSDLGRVCRPGSVKAVAVCRPESFASVHHLVSIVRGELAEGRDRADLIRALFPGGSMTGAPKVRAMQAIEDLEPVRRGIYAGAIGHLSFCGGMDLGMVIRTAILAGGRTWLQVGGGVVWGSDPEMEYRESLDKALSVRRALAAALTGSSFPPPAPERRTGHRRAAR